MCGITAYCGKGEALPFLMQGLSKLEYRGYDSAGVTTLENNQLITVKCKGRLENLENKLKNGQLMVSLLILILILIPIRMKQLL